MAVLNKLNRFNPWIITLFWAIRQTNCKAVDIRYSPFLGHPPSVLEFTPGAGLFVSLPGVLFPGKPHLSDNLE